MNKSEIDISSGFALQLFRPIYMVQSETDISSGFALQRFRPIYTFHHVLKPGSHQMTSVSLMHESILVPMTIICSLDTNERAQRCRLRAQDSEDSPPPT
jgi:hypothetical protein